MFLDLRVVRKMYVEYREVLVKVVELAESSGCVADGFGVRIECLDGAISCFDGLLEKGFEKLEFRADGGVSSYVSGLKNR